jgi:peptidoglycan glycosyltransferase
MSRELRQLAIAMACLFCLLVAQVTYVQVVEANRLANNPANAERQLIAEYRVLRGPILASNGTTVLAYSKHSPGTLVYQRHYTDGPLYSSVTGYYSLLFGRSGLESAENSYLAGDAPQLAPQTFSDLLLGRPKRGAAVVTTIDTTLQQAAQKALGNLPGAVVAMNYETGDVLAMYANPTFDPNPLSSQSAKTIQNAWNQLRGDPNQPLISRAKDDLYPPGSTFKMITASADLMAGADLSTTYPNPHTLQLPLTSHVLQNFGGEWCNGGSSTITLLDAFTVSCNVTFGEIGLKLGAAALQHQAQAYGFCPTDPPVQSSCITNTIPFVLPFATGRFPEPQYFQGNDPLVAISAIGQDNVLSNPFQMALVGSAIANGGTEMQPRLVSEILSPSGQTIQTFPPKVYGNPVTPTVADEMTTMMESVVQRGTGIYAQIQGVQVAGKTGTAQHGTSAKPDAWFVSFLPQGQNAPSIAVAVVVLDGGSLGSEATGGQVAAPIAKKVLEAALQEKP